MDISSEKEKFKLKISKRNRQNNKTVINIKIIHYLNYWVLGIWFVLRIVDLTLSSIAVSKGLGQELNPVANFIGFNFLLVLLAFLPIIALGIINYKLPNKKNAIYFIFGGSLILTVIQVVATLNVTIGWLFLS
ncbi:hypothetical protein LCGC14_1009070 [marine sediment metagenome]|uniref:DUF5658 domain-containing protein n=1 Tax=marine sediment metagenome TaxID=412755 RepID=A0A0F9N5A8_9ZZZZ